MTSEPRTQRSGVSEHPVVHRLLRSAACAAPRSYFFLLRDELLEERPGLDFFVSFRTSSATPLMAPATALEAARVATFSTMRLAVVRIPGERLRLRPFADEEEEDLLPPDFDLEE